MQKFIFNKKEYEGYQDMYKDMAYKMGCDKVKDYFDTKTFNYNPNILWECLLCDFAYMNKFITIIFINFDREEIKLQKNFDDYQYEMVLEIFEDFVKEYPNNKLEFRMEE